MTVLAAGGVGAGLYNCSRADAVVGKLRRHRRTEKLCSYDSPVNEERFARLVDVCWERGVRVEFADLGPRRHGQYRRDRRLIEMNHNLTLRQLVPGLAHEYAHAVHDDGCSTPAVERRAWEYAARMLISAEDYERAERIAGPHPNAVAAELDLTRVIVEAWQRQYERARDALLRRLEHADHVSGAS